MEYDEVIRKLRSHYNSRNVAGMARFGISSKNTLGVSMPVIRRMGKDIGKNHSLAAKLWDSGIHEARILAGLIDDPKLVSEKQMESWVCDFDSWDVCDQVCMNLFDKTQFSYRNAVEWSGEKSEFVKRAGFVMMASLAVHDKKADDRPFLDFLRIIKHESNDDRNFVRKAVNWALRQIGKRNLELNSAAIKAGMEIQKMDYKSAKWIASDALRELESPAVKSRLLAKTAKRG